MGILVLSYVMRALKKRRKLRLKENKERKKKESLIEEFCFLDSIYTLFEECENDKCSKKREEDLEKSEEATKEKECLFKKQESSKDEKVEKEQVELEKSENLREIKCKSSWILGSPMSSLSSEELNFFAIQN